MTLFLVGLALFPVGPSETNGVDAYWSLETDLGLSGTVERVESRLYLFKGGLAVQSFFQSGIDALDQAKAAADTEDDHFGKWSRDGAQLKIRWGGGRNPQTFTAKGSNLESPRLTWRPLKPVDGQRVAGLFAREDPKNDGAQLMLREDGTFAFRNAHKVSLIDLRPLTPNDGDGKYELRNWTIYLRYVTGNTATLSFELPHTQDAKEAEFLAIANQNFHRWPGDLKLPVAPKVETKKETIAGVAYAMPASWRRTDDGQTGATLIQLETADPGVLCLLTFPKPETSIQDAAALHKGMWVPITSDMDRLSGANAEKVGMFLRSWAALDRPVGGRIWIALYTMPKDGKAVSAMFAANREELFFRHYLGIEAMMKSGSPSKPDGQG